MGYCIRKYFIGILLLLVLIIGVVVNANAQIVEVNNNCKQAYSDILSLKFDDAYRIINREKEANPNNLFTVYLENYIDFLKITISEDKNLFDKLEPKVDDRIDEIERLDDSSPYKKYLIGNINLQWATTRAKFGQYATAAFEINRAYRLLEDNNELFPNFTPNYITLGVLHVMIGIIPDSYHWILNLISMHGDVIEGQNELKKAYADCEADENYNYLKDEVLFYMGMINLSFSPDPKFADYLINLISYSDKNNLLLKYLAINANMKVGNNYAALELFSTIDSTQNYYPFNYLNYLHGECHLRKLNLQKARYYFDEYLDKSNGQNYIKRAWQKKGWSYLFENDTVGYIESMQNVLLYGETNIDADKNAESMASSMQLPNIELLKARVLFDGGYYILAQNILQNVNYNALSTNNKIEVNYRLARIYQSRGKVDESINYYKVTIEIGSSSKQYFAANSALLLGNIYEQNNSFAKAAYYYKLCLDLDFDQYETSIKAKAKQGLARVGG